MKSNFFSSVEPRVALFTSSVYFVQGALSLAAVAFPLMLRAKGWSVSEIATFSFVAGLPWTLKVLYGALSDAVPVQGLRRKPYVLASSLFSSVGWALLAMGEPSNFLLYVLAVVANLGFAVTDVVTDAIVVEHSSEETTRVYQSLAWGSRSLGAILGGFLGGWLAGHVSHRLTFGLTALLPMVTFGLGLAIEEPRRKQGRSTLRIWQPIVEGLRCLFAGDLRWFCLLLITGSFSSSINTPFFFFLKEKLGFSEMFLGSLSSLAWGGAIVGCVIYGRASGGSPMRAWLRWAVWLNAVNLLTTLVIRDRMTATLFSLLGGVLGYLSLLPLMAVSALLAKEKRIEGALFALIMSVYNLGQLVAAFIGGRLFDIMGLNALILLATAVSLIGLLFIERLRTV